MSGDVSDRKRLVSITGPNLKHNHIYFSGHQDFFPHDCHGGSSKEKGIGRLLTLLVDGLPEPVRTDIATNSSNGNMRSFVFRDRAWVRKFFEKHEIREGDVIAIERVDRYTYHVYPFESKSVRDGSVVPDQRPPLAAANQTAASRMIAA